LNRFVLYLSVLFLFSCSSEQEESYLASYKEEHLLMEEVLRNMPVNVSDSAIFTKNYINDWIKDRVILNKAKLYIDEEDIEINDAVNKYKETLLIYKYQNELLNSQFDTTISKIEIEEYYNKYSSDFILHKSIVRARLVVMNKETLNLDKIKKLISTNKEDKLLELEDFCEMYAENNFLNDSVWVYLSEVIQKLPSGVKDNNKLLSYKNKIHSFTDDNFIYLLFVKDYQIKGNSSPLPFVFSNIRALLQNKNKRQFINNLEDKLYKEALSSEHIKIY